MAEDGRVIAHVEFDNEPEEQLRPSPLRQAVLEIISEQHKQAEIVAKLQERLEAVMTPVEPMGPTSYKDAQVSSETMPVPTRSEHLLMLVGVRSELQAQNERLLLLTQRLEV